MWRQFQTVVILEENMRHRHDKQYGEIMNRLRMGRITNQDLEILNSRVLIPEKAFDTVLMEMKCAQHERSIQFPFAVQNNKDRHCINWIALAELHEDAKVTLPFCVRQFLTLLHVQHLHLLKS